MSRQLTAALYVRVSTTEQNTDRQTHELREYAGRQGWSIVEYAEKASGSGLKKRPVLDRLMEDARMKRVDIVIVLAMDRFGRSLKQLIGNIEALNTYGVRFIALSQGIDTDKSNPISTLLMQLFAAFAQFERSIIVERVRSGVAEAQRKGKHCGRPGKVFRRDEAVLMSKQGFSLRQIAKKLGVPVTTLARSLKAVPKVLP